jgi:hypothetical protein
VTKWRLVTILLVLGCFGTSIVSAQETTTGTLAGQVLDQQSQAVVGATVSIISDQGTKNYTTDSTGRFFAPYLTPGSYTVHIKKEGFAEVEQKNITVRLGQRLDLDFSLKLSDRQEVIEVVGAPPAIDVSSTTVGGTIDSTVLKSLPIGRNLTSTFYMVPGVSDSSGVGNSNPSISGASGLENAYIVDGVNIASTGFGGIGSYSIVFGSLGTGVTQDFVKETQVKTAGFEAEFGQATGGVVNVVTQSGTNAFHGSVYSYASTAALQASWKKLETPDGTINTDSTSSYDMGATLGGPVVQDKLFFFAAANPQFQRRAFLAPPGFPLENLGAVTRKRNVYSYAGKLTYQATASHRFDFSAFGDPSRGPDGPQRGGSLLASTTSQYSSIKYGGHNQSFRYNGILTTDWLVEASVSHSANSINETPSNDVWSVADYRVTPTAVSGGIGYYDKGSNDSNWQYSLKSTNMFEAGGHHQLRYGVQFENIGFFRDINRTGPTFLLPNGQETRTGGSVRIYPDPVLGQFYRVIRANWGPNPETNAKYLSFFAQDTWQIGRRLTIRAGVRYDDQKLTGGGQKACNVGDSQVGAGDGTGAAIFCTYTLKNNWAPRVGFTYDVLGSGKSKLYANYGLYYLKVPSDLAARSLSSDAGVSKADYYDAALTQPIPDGVPVGATGDTVHFLTSGSSPALWDPNTKTSYQNEWVAGFEFEAAPALNLGIRYIRRTSPRVMEDIGTAPVVAYYVEDNLSEVQYFLTDITDNTPTDDFADLPKSYFEQPVHDMNAVELTINKTGRKFTIFGSYRYSKLKGNFEGSFRSDNGQSDPSITSLFDFPTNDISYTQIGAPEFGFRGDIRYLGTTLGDGILPNDRPHQFKLYGSYKLADVNLGMALNVGSGAALTILAANPVYLNSGEIPETLRGSGLDVLNGDGSSAGFRSRAPAEVFLDLHADYGFKFSGERRVVVLADVFNLFNNQKPLAYDTYTEQSFGALNANYGYPTNGGVSAYPGYHSPMNLRLGARIEW